MNAKPARHTADERRAEITAAAAIEFARRGLDGATTDRIAERAGVSQPYVVRRVELSPAGQPSGATVVVTIIT